MLFTLLFLGFPFALLVLMLGMERVEQPLRAEGVGDKVAAVLDSAQPDEVEDLVSSGLSTAVARHWRRHSRRTRLPLHRFGSRA